jgi:peptide/nickel transport system substrate-binding protein
VIVQRHHPRPKQRATRLVGLALVLLSVGLITQFAAASSTRTADTSVLVVDNVYNNHLLDPARETSSSANIALHAIYDTLVTYSGTDYSHVLPDLATSWTVSPDGKSITFNLRRGVEFSDGTPLTAKDVAFSYARVFNLKAGNSYLMNGVRLRRTGKYQVVLTSDVPNPALIRIAGIPAMGIVNSTLLAKHGGTAATNASTADTAESWISSNPAGSGPYMLQSFTPMQEIDLVRNPHYWGPRPTFDKVVIRNMDSASQLLNVQRGTDEIAVDVSPIDAATLSSNKAVQVVSGPGTKTFYMTVNQKPGVTVAANPLLMDAIRYGLDYNTIMALGGPQSQRLAGMIPYGLLGAMPPSRAIQTDVNRAKADIAKFGGPPPSFDVSYVTDFSFAGINEQTVAQAVQASLNALGFNANLVGRPIATHLAVRAAGGLQVNIGLQSINYPDPANYLAYCPGQPQAGYVDYVDPVSTKICNLAATTMGDKKRAAYYTELQLHWNTSGPYMPIMQPPAVLVGSANLTGLAVNGIWNVDVAKIGVKS